MATINESDNVSEAAVEPEVAAFMRLWGVSEDDARGMLELAKQGISWATPIVPEDGDFPTAA